MSSKSATCLIADIGGTHSRIALWDPTLPDRGIAHAEKFQNDNFDSLAAAIEHWQAVTGQAPARGILAVAGPVTGKQIELLNRDWAFDSDELGHRLGLSDLSVYNDFYAQAVCIPELTTAERLVVGPNRNARNGGPFGVIGPGTGLGIAGLTPASSGLAVISGEGGHATLAACNPAEDEIIARARARFGHCSAERLVSGTGLVILHELMHREIKTAQEISESAHADDARALATFDQFFSFLATIASNLALTVGAISGIYIAGGVAAKNRELLQRPAFRKRFIDKGRYENYLDQIPTWLISAPEPALIGLAAMARNSAQYTDDT